MVKRLFTAASKSILFKLILSYTIICVFILSIFSSVTYNAILRKSVDAVNAISEQVVSQSFDITELLVLSDYRYFLYTFNNNADISNGLRSLYFDGLEMGRINRILRSSVASHPLLHSIYVYNGGLDVFFSNYSSVQPSDGFFDTDILGYINKDIGYEGFNIREAEINVFGNVSHENLISYIYRPSASVIVPSVMVINFDQRVLSETILNEIGVTGGNQFIINTEGIIVLHENNGLFGVNVRDDESFPFLGRILDSAEISGTFTFKHDKTTSLISFKKSRLLGWVFINMGDYNGLMENLSLSRDWIVITTLIFIAAGIFVSLFFGRSIYRPVYDLIKKIRRQGIETDATIALDEYAYLNQTFDEMTVNLAKANDALTEYLPKVKNEMLWRILNGDAGSVEETDQLIRQYGFPYGSFYYVVCVLIPDLPEGCKDIEQIRFASVNLAQDVLKNCFPLITCEKEMDRTILLIGLSDDKPENEAKLIECLEKVRRLIPAFLSFSISFAVSGIAEDITGIPTIYRNAVEAAEYKLIFGKNSLIRYETICAMKEKIFTYPVKIERDIINAVKIRKGETVSTLLKEFEKQVNTYSLEIFLHAWIKLVYALLQEASILIPSERDNFSERYNTFNKAAIHFSSSDEILGWINELLLKIIFTLSNFKKDKNDILIDEIKKFVENNFSKHELTIETIAEQVNLSINYVRSIFKNKTGESLSNYILSFRLFKAKEMLKLTKLPAKKIAQSAGFNESRYFYVVFKKHTGYTPDEYRKTANDDLYMR